MRAWGEIDAPTVTVDWEPKPSTFTPSKPMNGTPFFSRKGTRSGENGVNDGPITKMPSRSTSFSAAARVRLGSPPSSSVMKSIRWPFTPPASLTDWM